MVHGTGGERSNTKEKEKTAFSGATGDSASRMRAKRMDVIAALHTDDVMKLVVKGEYQNKHTHTHTQKKGLIC